MLKALVHKPVGMPAPDSYQSTSTWCDDVLRAMGRSKYIRLNELTQYHTDVGGLYPGLYLCDNKSF